MMNMLKSFKSIIAPFSLSIVLLVSCFYSVSANAQTDESNGHQPQPDYVIQIEQQYKVIDDPAIVGRVNGIKDRLLAIIPKAEMDGKEITVKILDDKTVNAFAVPNGYVYLFKGLCDKCDTDDMLAGVMAHEFTHIIHNHHASIGDRQLRGLLIGLIAMIATGETEGALLGQMIAAGMVESYGRTAEEDADRTGIGWLVDAGYDPLGFYELLQVLEQEAIHSPGLEENYFSIHPYPKERMDNFRQALEEKGIKAPENYYRVHLKLDFYLPLSSVESSHLELWENELKKPKDDKEENSKNKNGQETEDDKSDSDDIPFPVLNEYRLRKDMFSTITVPENYFVGVVAVDNTGIFYIAESSREELSTRAESIISRLGDSFIEGVRSYEIEGKKLNGVPTLLARRKKVAYATESDSVVLGLSPDEINSKRVELLRDILFRYFVGRRI